MLNLSIMPLDINHIDEICEDIIWQQKNGVSTHAMFMMKFNPEGTPAVNKAVIQCAKYDLFREKLDRAGAKHGVLVQATLGHISKPFEPYPFQPSVFLSTGEERVVTCCPADPAFRAYIKEQMRILAEHKPSIVMIDDDVGLLYKATRGCACKYHMEVFNRLAGKNMTREEVYAHTQGCTEEDKYYTDLYVQAQREGLVGAVRAMREGLDEVDPTIQGCVSGIYTSTFLEFSDDTAEAFAGSGNPRIVRLNGGPYAKNSHRYFTNNMFRAAILRENTKGKVDIYLAETDVCPHNRYSTSAALMHSHFTASLLEGANGAKHWITRLGYHEPEAGKAFRKILAKYAGFYEKLAEYTKVLKPFGCRIPLTLMQDYGFIGTESRLHLSPWSTVILENLGLPLYFSNDEGGAVFIDDFSVNGFDNDEIKSFMRGTLVLSAGAAETLVARGLTDFLGVEVREWIGAVISTECIDDAPVGAQFEVKELCVCREGVEALSWVMHRDEKDGSLHKLFPGVTRFQNPLGGETIVFSGNPDMIFKYSITFSMLNGKRKQQFIDILGVRGHVPVYYPEDVEVYVRAGCLPDGEILCAVFNKSFDCLDDIPLVCEKPVSKIEKLNPDGTRSTCSFTCEDGVVRIAEPMLPYIPVVLLIS